MQCQDHNIDMIPFEGRLICPEAGCPRTAPLPPPVDPDEAKRQKEAEEEASKLQKKEIEDPLGIHG